MMALDDRHYARIYAFALAEAADQQNNITGEARVTKVIREALARFYHDTIAAGYDYDNVERVVRRAFAAGR